MSSTLGLAIGSVRRQRAGWPGVGAGLSFAAVGLLVAIDPALSAVGAALVCVAMIVIGLAGWRAGARTETGRIVVDAGGRGCWIAATSGGEASPVSISPRRWRLDEAEVWLLAHDAHGRRLHLRATKPVDDDRHWHALRRWLVWSGRGARAPGASLSVGNPASNAPSRSE